MALGRLLHELRVLLDYGSEYRAYTTLFSAGGGNLEIHHDSIQ